ncbi:FAD-dependent oxidoreductase [Lyngbya aestuarii]|uniref:FAD-dependent oxidoreductase n=1 Tax=Lyngbya aestuarii TaxID=118322 RepID=UPI00403D9312
MERRPQIVIVGAGFGGLTAARLLNSSEADILLIDRNNYHTFVPLLYQVATAELQPEQIAYPVRSILRRLKGVSFLQANIKRVDFTAQVVETEGQLIDYDFLILGTGSQSRYLEVPGAQEYTLPMRTLEDAIALRNQILRCFEQAVQELDPEKRQKLLTFAIVGGGPTGVELAGSLMELIGGPLHQDYPSLQGEQVRVILLQSGPRLLADLPKRLGEYTQNHLRKMGVKVHLQTKVSSVTPDTVHIHDDDSIATQTIVWTAGMEANFPVISGDFSTAIKGKIVVEPTLQLPGHPKVYALGDVAYVEYKGQPLIGVAPEAIQQGEAVAANIKLQLRGKEPQSFKYKDKGRAAIISRNAGVAHTPQLTLTGFPAWLLWLGIHWCYLPGWRNRIGVICNWIFDYVRGDRVVRQILP